MSKDFKWTRARAEHFIWQEYGCADAKKRTEDYEERNTPKEEPINIKVRADESNGFKNYFTESGQRLCPWSSYERLYDQNQSLLEQIVKLSPIKKEVSNSRDWEIVSYYWDGRFYYTNASGEFRCDEYRSGAWSILSDSDKKIIHSVRRLSDNTVWTVGELHSGVSYPERTISSFSIENGECLVGQSGGTTRLSSLTKLPISKEPFFYEHNDNPIFEGEVCWWVGSEFEVLETMVENNIRPNPAVKFFSTKEKAEEYVQLNKKEFSLKDIEAAYRKAAPLYSPLYNNFINELKSKIN